MKKYLLLPLLGAAALALGAYAYVRPPARHSVPPSLYETASVPGYGSIRFWADVASPAFNASVEAKDHALVDDAQSGHAPQNLTTANFLAISGGGDQGAFAAGLLSGWSRQGSRPTFEAVTGVSAGALAAPFAFLGPAHDGELRDIFTNFGPGGLYRGRGPLGLVGDAMNDTAPLAKLIRQYATDAFLDTIAAEYRRGRRIYILTTNLDAERPVIWDLSAIAATGRPDRRDLFVDVLLASAAVPGVFPPVRINVVAGDGKMYEELHVDGGVTAQILYGPPDVQLLKIEDKIFPKRRDRNLYVIRNGRLLPEFNTSNPNALMLSARAIQTMVKYQVVSDLLRLQKIATGNNTKFYFNSIPPSFTLRPAAAFSEPYSKELYKAGLEVGLHNRWDKAPPASPQLDQRPPPGDTSDSQDRREDR